MLYSIYAYTCTNQHNKFVDNTEVCCFYCGMMIEVEEQIEDPLMVHARFAPKCSFIVDKIKKMDSYNFIQEQEYLGKVCIVSSIDYIINEYLTAFIA